MVEISVIIPAYNAIDYLDEAINSIINQSFRDLEIICVDDGSTDNTLEVLQSYASKDNRIQVYHQENQGPGGAINTGLSKAKGKYIYVMDADDILDLNALDDLYNIMEEKDLDFVIFKAINYDEGTGKYYEHDYFTMPKLQKCVGDSVFDWRDIGDNIFYICVTSWSKLYKHELIKENNIQMPSNVIYEDNIFFWQILFNSSKIYFYDKFLYTRRVHSSFIIHSRNERSVDTIKITDLIIQTFIDYGYFEEFKDFLYNRKVSAVHSRYKLINEEFKEFFFTEMKKDFEKIRGHEKYDEFYSNLYTCNKTIFNNVIESETHVEYDLREELSNLNSEYNDLKMEVNSLKKKNKKLDEKVMDLNKFNKSLLSSKSWKFTKPFRSFKNFLRKLK